MLLYLHVFMYLFIFESAVTAYVKQNKERLGILDIHYKCNAQAAEQSGDH